MRPFFGESFEIEILNKIFLKIKKFLFISKIKIKVMNLGELNLFV